MSLREEKEKKKDRPYIKRKFPKFWMGRPVFNF